MTISAGQPTDAVNQPLPGPVFRAMVETLNLSVRRGYHPVATVDETDKSWEIEARLDQNHLLLLQIWPSGVAEGLIHSDAQGFKAIDAATVSDVLVWLSGSGRKG